MAKILNFQLEKAKLENKQLTIATYHQIREQLQFAQDDIVYRKAFFMFCEEFVKSYNDIEKFL